MKQAIEAETEIWQSVQCAIGIRANELAEMTNLNAGLTLCALERKNLVSAMEIIGEALGQNTRCSALDAAKE